MVLDSAHKERCASLLLEWLPFIVVAMIWLYFAVLDPVPFWQQTGDYSWYALSHAFTFEAKVEGYRAANFGYNIHPGVPFGIVSWIAFRIATYAAGDSGERVVFAINHGEAFWAWAKFIALVLNLSGMYVLKRMFKGDVVRFCIACCVYFAAVPASFGASFLQLTNESFALVYIVTFYWLLFKLLSEPDAVVGIGKVEVCFVSTRGLLSFCLGALTAFGLSMKIYYTAPAFGLVAGFWSAVVFGSFDKKSVLRLFGIFLGSFVLSGWLVVAFIVGFPALKTWIIWNYGMLSHSNHYGSGGQGFIQLSSVFEAIKSLIFTTSGTFPMIVAFVVVVFFSVVIKNANDKSWRRRYFPFVVAISFGMFINLTGLLKHYAQHYALPLCASLVCLLLIQGNVVYSRVMSGFALSLVVMLFAVNLNSYAKTHMYSVDMANAVIRDCAIIEKLPISSNEVRVWGYFSPTNNGILPMIKQYSGSDFISGIILKNSSPVDIVPSNERDVSDWRYVLFPKTYYPSRESVFENYRQVFDFKATKFEIVDTDNISELETFFLLVREHKDPLNKSH